MTMQDWGAIGELVGGVAVIATLAYLAIQTRQARRSVLAEGPQWIFDGYRSWVAAPRQDPELAQLILRATQNWSELSPVDQFRVHAWWGEKIVHLEAVISLFAQGSIDEGLMRAWVDDALAMILTPGGRQWWADTKHLFAPNTRVELERRPADPASLPDGWTTTLPWFRVDQENGQS